MESMKAIESSDFKGASMTLVVDVEEKSARSSLDKHFLFQAHHRQPQPQVLEHKQHQQQRRGKNRHPASPISTTTSTTPETQASKKPKGLRRTVARPFKRVARFLERLLDSLKSNDTAKTCNKDKDVSPLDPTPSSLSSKPAPEPTETQDPGLQYLSIVEDNSEDQIARKASEQERPEHFQQPPPLITLTPVTPAKPIPKMMKILDKIMDHIQSPFQGQDEPAPTANTTAPTNSHISSKSQDPSSSAAASKIAPTTATEATSASAVVQKRRHRARGPRMHPMLLELYDVTDHVLGVGTFATVKEIKLKTTGQSFALKIILKKPLQGKGAMLDTEINVLSKVRHPNCVSLLEMFETEDAVYLVTDLAAGGELFEQLLQKGNYTEGDAARLVREILLGVEYLHSMDIVHRDLKPENLLFVDKTENARLMITDFGLSKVLTNGNDVLMTACGTPGYVAPEVLEQIGHGKPVDMWSVGIIAYTLLCGYTPFWGEDQPTLFDNIIAGEYEYEDEYWRDISPLAKSFIDKLLVRPAEKRATATQALDHPWFRAMLDQDLVAPASPSDSVNLLPSVRKNFNARTAFKKAVRAVGILRKMQASQSPPANNNRQNQGEPNHSAESSAGSIGEDAGAGVSSQSQDGANSKIPVKGNTTLRFHEVVGAAIMVKQGVRVKSMQGIDTQALDGDVAYNENESGMLEPFDREEHLMKANTDLESLAVASREP